jgi:alpha/beta superfamily hydrolase
VASNESFDLQGPSGRLEAILMLPDGEPHAAAVVCHAHPLHGGVMHFKPVFRAAKALQACGLAALRFNFRGVGRSQGQHDHGRGEQDDVRAALGEMERRFPGRPLLLAGFSFGAVMALRVSSADPRVRAVAVLGFPASMAGTLDLVKSASLPRLFIQGALDSFGAPALIRSLAASLPGPSLLVVVPEADHFFKDHLDQLEDALLSWARRRPWETA